MATVTQHREISERFLSHAEKEFEKGDLLQASEKAWGVVAHYEKSVARDQEDWEADSHAGVNRCARELMEHTDDPEGNRDRLGTANSLHANFQESFYDEDMVESGIKAARELVAAMKTARTRLNGAHRPSSHNGS